MMWMRGKAQLEQEVLLKLKAGGCRLRAELPSEFRQTEGLTAQSIYVVRNVVQNFLDIKFSKFVPRNAAGGRTVFRQMSFPVIYPDYQIRLDIDVEVTLTPAGSKRLHKFLHTALLRANAALVLMLAEHLEQDRLLTNGELESLFSFVEEAAIQERDILVSLPNVA